METLLQHESIDHAINLESSCYLPYADVHVIRVVLVEVALSSIAVTASNQILRS